jgi:hypothetical protein
VTISKSIERCLLFLASLLQNCYFCNAAIHLLSFLLGNNISTDSLAWLPAQKLHWKKYRCANLNQKFQSQLLRLFNLKLQRFYFGEKYFIILYYIISCIVNFYGAVVLNRSHRIGSWSQPYDFWIHNYNASAVVLDRLLQIDENILVFKTHYVGYSWRCKFLQHWRCKTRSHVGLSSGDNPMYGNELQRQRC